MALWTPAGRVAAADPPRLPAGDQPLRADWIPPRPPGAVTGSEFADRTRKLSGRQRQAAALAELERGNLPDHLRTLRPVRLRREEGSGEAVVWVMPDYLSLGSDADSLRMPLTLPSAVAIASRLGFVLPTRKIVDAIYEQADERLTPIPMPPGPSMRSSSYYLRHHQSIERQRRAGPPGALVAGHKKDVVLTNRLGSARGRIAIYGWHRRPGRPIQPLSTVHGARYADYSHGLRLVLPIALIDGAPHRLVDALEDPGRVGFFSYEGPFADAGALLDPAAVAAASP